MNINIQQTEGPFQGQTEQVDHFMVFRTNYSLGKGIKKRIKSFGCNWHSLYQGWLCPLVNEDHVRKALVEANVTFTTQRASLPKGMVHSNPKIAGRQSRLEILEVRYSEEYGKLLQDIYSYDPLLRPEDFEDMPIKEGKSEGRFSKEADFHERSKQLIGIKREMELAKQELSHLASDGGEKVFDVEAPLLIAEGLIQKTFMYDSVRTLQYSSGTFWRWEGTKYLELAEEAVRKIVYDFLRDAKKLDDRGCFEDFNPNKFRVDQVLDALKAVCFHEHCPAGGATWLDGRIDPDPRCLISFRNGLLNIKDWINDPKTGLTPHTPLMMNVNALSFDFDPNAAEPKEWLQFLQAIWPDDPESQQALQEWMGYFLVQDTSLHKILLLIGPPRSGKGTIGRVQHELLGPFNVAGPTLSSLGGEFGLQPLLNKMLATISDARVNSRSNSIIVERLLSISGEDPLTINRKFLPPLTVQLPTRIMMMSNELPEVQDASGALAGRFIILAMTKSWLGQEDTKLFDRLRLELSGILLWALNGLARLKERGKFIQPASSSPLVEELNAMTSPMKEFVAERCQIKAIGRVPVTVLFKEWLDWSNEWGYPTSGNVQTFGKNLRAAFPWIRVVKPQEGEKRVTYYTGISLIPFKSPSADVRDHVEDGYYS